MKASEIADNLTRRRARFMPVIGILFLAQQAAYFSQHPVSRPPDHFKVAAWLCMALALLLFLVAPAGLFRSRAVKNLMNDETTRAHRLQAFYAGFIAMITCCIALYAFDQFEPVEGRDAIHLILSVGIAAAIIRNGMLERRALSGVGR